jgi:predicted PurR-regulated permease PerM
MEQKNSNLSKYNFDKIVDLIIRLGVLSLLLIWCYAILKPFILILIWSVVIAIAIFPIHKKFVKIFKGKKSIATFILITLLLSVVIIPSGLILYSLYEGLNYFQEIYAAGKPLIPAPGGNTANWPSIAKPIKDFWQLSSDNLQEVILKYSDQVKEYGSWLLLTLAGLGEGIIYFSISIIVSGFLLIYSDSSESITKKIFRKLAGKNGDNFVSVIVITIRNVIKGVFGVAVIQAVMAGIGFFFAGVPFAGLWTILALILAIVQVGLAPIVIPVAIYMFSVTDSTSAVFLAIWLGIALLSDNILKPILLGRNAPAPMMVIFIGSIGGFVYNGFIGLFLGAIVLTIGYKLLMIWLETENEN